jgi:hypothetical protein
VSPKIEAILGSGVLRGIATLMAITLSGIGLYTRYAGINPAMTPKEFKFQTEKGVVIFEIERTGAIPKPAGIDGVVSLKMTTKAVVIAWRTNLRDDCFLIQRNTGMVNLAGLNVDLAVFTGALAQGEKGSAISLIPVKVPSDIVPGKYTAYNDEVYKCGETISTYKYPKVQINVRY